MQSSSTSHINQYPWQSGNAHTIKSSLRRFFTALWRGPSFPRDDSPQPIHVLLLLERLPYELRSRTSLLTRGVILVVYMAIWCTIAFSVLLPYLTKAPQIAGDPNTPVLSLTCDGDPDFWKGKNAACGLNAEHCPTFNENEDVIIRCPALCDRGSWLYSLRAIGDQIIKYRGYFVGGGAKEDGSEFITHPYRADSFPCGAGVHAGIISPVFGGCARLSYSSGPQASFESTKGSYGVGNSIGFSSFFPKTFAFKPLDAHVSLRYDPRFLVLILNVILGIPVVFFGSGAEFTWIMTTVGFWTISLATDPPILVEPLDPESFFELISMSLGRFLPTCFVLYVLWKVSIRRTFGSVKSGNYLPVEEASPELNGVEEPPIRREPPPQESSVSKVLLWYPFFWLGILNNVTFDRLPVDRLTWHDLQVQPGALMTVSIVACILVFCIVAQAYYVWLLGRFWKLLSVYGIMFGSLFLIASIPGLTLRIHHYIFALMFIPGCSTRGRTAYVFQGLLLGLFLSGVARWDYAPIAETNLSLLRGEPTGKTFAPLITNFDLESGSLYWVDFNNSTAEVDAQKQQDLNSLSDISLLINDVERMRGPSSGSVNFTELLEDNEELKKMVQLTSDSANAKDNDGNFDIFIRIAKYNPATKRYGDFSRSSIFKYPSNELVLAPAGIT